MTYARDGTRQGRYNVSVDRVNSKIGYVEGNVQLICARINEMKSDMSEDEFLGLVKTIYLCQNG